LAAAMKPMAARAFKASINQALPAPPRVGKTGIIEANFPREALGCQACGRWQEGSLSARLAWV